MKSRNRSFVRLVLPPLLGLLAIVATAGLAADARAASPNAAAKSTAAGLDFDWSWRLAPGKTIEIEGVNGAIRAIGTTGKDVVVHARKHARRSDPSRVTIEVLEHADGITLCVRYPDTRGGGHNTCAPHGDSHMNTSNNDVQVDFDVQVPAGVRLEARTVNGAVEARGLDADAEVHTVNGSVVLETRGRGEASTVNGSVSARLGTVGLHGPLSFETVNGSITVELPDDASAEVTASTVNGGIDCDFPITVQRLGHVRHRLHGTIGRGGPLLELTTVNGGVRLRKASSL